MEIKPCGGAVFYRGACRDRYLGRRDCAGCEPLAPLTVAQGDGKTFSVDAATADETTAHQTTADEPAKPRAPRGAKRRP